MKTWLIPFLRNITNTHTECKVKLIEWSYEFVYSSATPEERVQIAKKFARDERRMNGKKHTN